MNLLQIYPLFIHISFLDILDIILVAYLIYTLYKLIKGSIAINIFIGIVSIYLVWKLVSALQMEMLSEILGQFIGVGVIALIIVFQQEIRKFLLLLGTRNFFGNRKRFLFWKLKSKKESLAYLNPILKAFKQMSENKTGALVVFEQFNNLDPFINSGELIQSNINEKLILNLFFKNSPLHDGALIIREKKIVAAKCILPISGSKDFPSNLGLRHRAAVGITEQTDAISIIVSEQNGNISFCENGIIQEKLSTIKLRNLLEKTLK